MLVLVTIVNFALKKGVVHVQLKIEKIIHTHTTGKQLLYCKEYYISVALLSILTEVFAFNKILIRQFHRKFQHVFLPFWLPETIQKIVITAIYVPIALFV